MSALEKTYLTPEQYLEIERKAEFRSEYYAGEMFAMAGGTVPHNVVGGNVFGLLWLQLRGRPCQTFTGDMKLHVQANSLYAYPDVSVVCGDIQFFDGHRDIILNPLLIVEVRSPSTAAYDRGAKFALYQRLESLTDYLIVSQDRMRVEHFVRQPDNHWLSSEASGPEAEIEIVSLGCRLALSDIYDKVEIAPAAP